MTDAAVTFVCSLSNASAILTDGGAAALSTGSFLMQQGTYQVQFYGPFTSGCGQMQATVDNVTRVNLISSNVGVACPANTNSGGLIADAVILTFGVNQVLKFTVSGSLIFAGFGANVIITQLQ